MKAIILAAGRGSRMGAITDKAPKCMSILRGLTLIEWQIQTFKKMGITDPIVITGYQNQSIQKHLGAQVTYLNHPRWDQTNMVGTMLRAKQIGEKEPVIISYSDIVYRSEILKKLISTPIHGSSITITYDTLWSQLWSERFEDPLSDAESFRVSKNGHILEIGSNAKSIEEIQGQFMGLVRIEPNAWDFIEECFQKEALIDFTSLLQKMIQSKRLVHGLPIRGGWTEIDTKNDLDLAIRNTNSMDWSHDWRSI